VVETAPAARGGTASAIGALWIGIIVAIAVLAAVISVVAFLVHRRSNANAHKSPDTAETSTFDDDNIAGELECENPLAYSDEFRRGSASADPDETQFL
jgi:flagellar basal body-associated protein FliL